MQSAEEIIKQADPTSGGGSVNYYSVCVEHPQHCPNAYVAECEDIIEALELNFDEYLRIFVPMITVPSFIVCRFVL